LDPEQLVPSSSSSSSSSSYRVDCATYGTSFNALSVPWCSDLATELAANVRAILGAG
jgi:hypothetical protein